VLDFPPLLVYLLFFFYRAFMIDDCCKNMWLRRSGTLRVWNGHFTHSNSLPASSLRCLHNARRANRRSYPTLPQQSRAAKGNGKVSCTLQCRRTAHAPLTEDARTQAHNEAELRPQTTPFLPCCRRPTQPSSQHENRLAIHRLGRA
jgi:hypothetical protein